MPSIVLISTGSPATNPRLVKEANALHTAGYRVHVLYSHVIDWAEEIDAAILKKAPWSAELIGGGPSENILTFRVSSWSFKFMRRIRSLNIRATRLTRTSHALSKAARQHKADLFIAHNLGALPAAVIGAQCHKARAAFDAEDYHYGEFPANTWEATLTKHVEDKWIPKCAATWSASPLISHAYRKRFSNHAFDVVDNVFPLSQRAPRTEDDAGVLRMMWFSQTIGEGRGLEPFFNALQVQKKGAWSLTLIGRLSPSFEGTLQEFQKHFPNQVHTLPPMKEKDLFKEMGKHDIGLALEMGTPLNRDLCRTNKLFSFILNGCYLCMTNTQAQTEFMAKHPSCGSMVPLESPASWPTVIGELIDNREKVTQGKQSNWTLGESHLNWEVEQEKLLTLVKNALET